jgi:proline dehydrogenase
MSLLNSLVVHSLPIISKSVVGAVLKRYIAGETLEEALEVALDLNRRGFMPTVDLLGEDTTQVEQARRAADDYRRVLKAIALKGIEGNISVKPTQFGLNLDMHLCTDFFRGLIEEARSLGYFVRVEMENSTCTQAKMELYSHTPRRLRQYGNRTCAALRPTSRPSLDSLRTSEWSKVSTWSRKPSRTRTATRSVGGT